jgi:hypothetical protein
MYYLVFTYKVIVNDNYSLLNPMWLLAYLKNIRHVLERGCYCFLVVEQNGDLTRYNRWGDTADLTKVSTFRKM